MGAEQKRRLRMFTEGSDKIGESDRSARRPIGKGLRTHVPAELLQLHPKITAGFFERVGCGRPWSELDQFLHVCKGFRAGKFLPNLFRPNGGSCTEQERQQNRSNRTQLFNFPPAIPSPA